MKFIFAGTSHGLPEKGRGCTSTFLCINEQVYIFDAGCDISSRLKDYDIPHSEVKAIFITHFHSDHFDGLPPFCDQIKWYFKDSDPDFYFPEQKCADVLKIWTDILVTDHTKEYKFNVYSDNFVYEDENVKISAVRTKHLENSFAFIIEAEGKTVFLTGDMKYGYPEYFDILGDKKYDLVISEGVHHNPGSFNESYKKTNTKKLIIHHLHPLHEAEILKIRNETDFVFKIAYDNMVEEL